jgi:hypothetical protein
MAVIPAHVVDGATILTAWGNQVSDALQEHENEINDATTGNTALGTRVTAVESGKVATTRTISTTNGLQGGGDLSANRTLSPVYGTAVNTVAQGNDSRITVTQDATIGNSALGTRTTALENNAPNTGRGTLIAGVSQQAISANTWTTVTFPGTVIETPVGFSYSAGVFTFTKFGKWKFSATFAQGSTTVPPVGSQYAFRFRRTSDSNTFGQSIVAMGNTSFGAGTGIGWECKVDSTNAVWVVEIICTSAFTIAADSRTGVTMTYLGP